MSYRCRIDVILVGFKLPDKKSFLVVGFSFFCVYGILNLERNLGFICYKNYTALHTVNQMTSN